MESGVFVSQNTSLKKIEINEGKGKTHFTTMSYKPLSVFISPSHRYTNNGVQKCIKISQVDLSKLSPLPFDTKALELSKTKKKLKIRPLMEIVNNKITTKTLNIFPKSEKTNTDIE